MQPIERVGVFALLFLVVTVVAVVLWDKSPDDPQTATTAKDRAPSEANARNARDGKTRGLGQLDDPSTRESQIAKTSANPREPLPTASNREGVLPAATRAPLDESAALSLVEGTETEEEPPAVEEAPGKKLAKRDLGPDPQSTAKTASAPTTVIAPRVVERAPNAIHVVKSGETLSDIATARLGQASRWKEIADLNGVDPAKLHVGKELRLPADAVAKGEAPAAKPVTQPAAQTAKSTYRVQPGDSLWRIAERELGDGDRWKEIANANPGIDANRLVAGATLNLPAGRKTASSTTAAPAKATSTPAKAPTTVASAGTAKKKGTVR